MNVIDLYFANILNYVCVRSGFSNMNRSIAALEVDNGDASEQTFMGSDSKRFLLQMACLEIYTD